MALTTEPHIPNPGSVPVSPAAKEFLVFRVLANGPEARFLFSSDVKGVLLNQGTFLDHPTTKYEWAYLREESDIQQFELLSVGLLFATNQDYRYQVSVHGPAGHIRDVLDIEYSGGPTDFDTEVFRVLIV